MSLYDRISSLKDVNQLILDGQRESETLEYKRADETLTDEKRAEVAKDVSAFANSAGGVLIYGVETRRTDDRMVPVRVVPIDARNIERIHRVITGDIRHPIPGVRTKPIPSVADPQVFLVDVPASFLAPHQSALDKRYYRRQLDQSVPMTHELVELYFGRRLGPILVPELRLEAHHYSSQSEFVLMCSSTLWLRNVGSGTAREVVAAVRLRPGSQSKVSTSANVGGSEFSVRAERGGRIRELRAHPQRLVIHPEDDSELLYFHLEMAAGEFWNAADPESWIISLSAMSANMRPQRFNVYVGWDPPMEKPEFKITAAEEGVTQPVQDVKDL